MHTRQECNGENIVLARAEYQSYRVDSNEWKLIKNLSTCRGGGGAADSAR